MNPTPDKVILIHGYGMNRLTMVPLKVRMRRFGFAPRIWSYPSLFQSIRSHVPRLKDFLEDQHQDGCRVHVVAHSMGSIITRLAIAECGFEGIGRVVLLAPPNRGAPFATALAPLLQHVSHPLGEMSTSPTSLVNSMPTSFPVDLGVIAGRFDLTVPSSRTHLESERNHITINATHNSMLLSGQVANLSACFLNHGEFKAE